MLWTFHKQAIIFDHKETKIVNLKFFLPIRKQKKHPCLPLLKNFSGVLERNVGDAATEKKEVISRL